MGRRDIITNFLAKVEKRLPGWLKENEAEKEDVLAELEEHIWDKATELAEGGEPTAADIQSALNTMGSPATIAREYKKRGTPKIFISEELWPFYLKGIKGYAIFILAINIIVFAISVFSKNIWTAFGDLFSGLFNGFIYGAVLVTVLFVVFSMEGFLPEDFKEMSERNKQETKTLVDKPEMPWKTSKKPKPPIKRGDLIAEGIFGSIWGILLMTMPFPSINEYLGPQMVEWLIIAGVFSFLGAIISIIRSLIGVNMINGQRVLIGLNAVVDIAFAPRWLYFGAAVLSVPAVQELPIDVIDTLEWIFSYFPILVIIGITIGVISAIYTIATLRYKHEKYLKNIGK